MDYRDLSVYFRHEIAFGIVGGIVHFIAMGQRNDVDPVYLTGQLDFAVQQASTFGIPFDVVVELVKQQLSASAELLFLELLDNRKEGT